LKGNSPTPNAKMSEGTNQESQAFCVAAHLAEAVEESWTEFRSATRSTPALEVASGLLETATSAGAVDQALSIGLGLPHAVVIEIFLSCLARQLLPDPKILVRIESKLDVVLEAPMRTGLELFESALKLPGASGSTKLYRDDRIHDAQRKFDEAWGILRGKKSKNLLSEEEFIECRTHLALLRALCAASRQDGHEEAALLSKEPLARLRAVEADHRAKGLRHRDDQRWALELPDWIENENISPEQRANIDFQGQMEKIDKKLGQQFWSPDIDTDKWLLAQKRRPRSALQKEARVKAEKHAALAREEELLAERYRGIFRIITASLTELSIT
jgi:hypothetical protein